MRKTCRWKQDYFDARKKMGTLMTKADLAEIVAHAREALREWDGKTATRELAERIRDVLSPLVNCAEELSADARRKLLEIERWLERLADVEFTPEDREALDMLMLGRWIRVDDNFTSWDNS